MDLEILHDYLIESKELLEKAQEDALRLEADPGNEEALASIFQAFHTIKGGAGFLEAGHLVEWAHYLEDLLEKLRSGKLPATSPRIDAVLKGIDVIERMFSELTLMSRAPRPNARMWLVVRGSKAPTRATSRYPIAKSISHLYG